MAAQQKIEYDQLEIGYELPVSSYTLDAPGVSAYLEAVEDSSDLYREASLVPPTAVAARAMTALSEGISLPAGAIHVSQELEFKDTVSVNDALTSHARVKRKQGRGKFHMLTIGIDVFKQGQEAVLTGETSFILPLTDDGR